jgi:aryl-alcohol dehydrogenase
MAAWYWAILAEGLLMTTQIEAAVCYGPDRPFAMETLTLDDPREGEILVRIAAVGICHTDLSVRDGQLPVPLPAVLGHEGAGVIERVGTGVTGLAVGDRVILSFNSCGNCPSCAIDSPTYCYNFGSHNFTGTRADGSHTLTRDGVAINGQFFGQSSFATHVIAHARNAVKLPQSAAHLPLSTLAPLGCGLMTGAGAVLRSLKVRAGLPIAIFGSGAVGLAAVMAARIAGAAPIIAVDIHQSRRTLALELGATHALDGADDPFARIAELCPQGLGYAFDTTGIAAIIEQACELLAPMGVLGIVGASDFSATLTFNEARLMGGGRTVKGILGGDSDLQGFIPELIEHHLAGRFPHDRLIRTFPFADINQAVAASESGEVVKSVLVLAEE